MTNPLLAAAEGDRGTQLGSENDCPPWASSAAFHLQDVGTSHRQLDVEVTSVPTAPEEQ
jgi:hypothetical protein